METGQEIAQCASGDASITISWTLSNKGLEVAFVGGATWHHNFRAGSDWSHIFWVHRLAMAMQHGARRRVWFATTPYFVTALDRDREDVQLVIRTWLGSLEMTIWSNPKYVGMGIRFVEFHYIDKTGIAHLLNLELKSSDLLRLSRSLEKAYIAADLAWMQRNS